MAKSRVEKNKELYNEIELESFEIEDISEKASVVEEKKEPENKIVKKNEVAIIEQPHVEETEIDDDFEVEQPLSYTDKLSVEEILRAKLEKQQQLKDNKKVYKKSPITSEYTPEMMQKNINQQEGVNVRKEANIKVKNGSNTIVIALSVLLILVLVFGVVLIAMIWKK